MAELYSNALEHGVLELDSRLKRDAQGFADYYRQRNERLGQLNSGYVRVHVQVVPTATGGKMTLRIEDSGPGFDVEQVLARPMDVDRLSGRGLSLVRQLSSDVRWSDGGRSVCVEFCWGLWHNPPILDQGANKWLRFIWTPMCCRVCRK